MTIKFLEHTADVKMRVTGQNLPELFSEALAGMFQTMKTEGQNGQTVKRTVRIKSADLTSLLIDFLAEVLAQSDIYDEIYNRAKFSKLTETGLEAELFGRPLRNKALEIKAVTYHQNYVRKINGGYEAEVVFDI